jgi:hypothetical protein
MTLLLAHIATLGGKPFPETNQLGMLSGNNALSATKLNRRRGLLAAR